MRALSASNSPSALSAQARGLDNFTFVIIFVTIIIIEIRTGSIRKPQTVERRRFSLLAKRWKFKPFVAKIKQYYLQHIAKIGRYYKLSFLVEAIQVTHLVSTILLGSFMLADIL